MSDSIVYTLVAKPGGIDGRDPLSRGGKQVTAHTTREEAQKDPNAPWCDIEPIVVDLVVVARTALAKLTPVERLAIAAMSKGYR